jgi:hypothetical protein
MTTLGELGAFELALALGRAVGPEEVDGFNYGSPYMHMVGAIRSAKANKGQSLPVSDSKILVFSDESGPVRVRKNFAGLPPRTPQICPPWHDFQTHIRILPLGGGCGAIRNGSASGGGVILVGDKEEPSSKRGHGDACASAGGVWTATLASRPLREGRAPSVRVRCGRLGPVKRVLYRPRTCLGRRYTHQ